jgi:L-threonylcarbamoyladenylate synthase
VLHAARDTLGLVLVRAAALAGKGHTRASPRARRLAASSHAAMIRLILDGTSDDDRRLAEAARRIREGEVIAFPTDTVYGLAADPCNDAAVAQLFEIKGRASEKRVPLIAASAEQVEATIGALPPLARRLAARFWPGPLTLIVPAARRFSAGVAGEDQTVAVRVPAHGAARALAALVGRAITATSANRSGAAPAVRGEDVVAELSDVVGLVLDDGPSRVRVPSTIVDVTTASPRLVRAGAVPWERVLESLQ